MVSILGGLVWASFAPFSLLFGVYLRSLGLSYTNIGLLMTTASMLSTSPQLMFGAIADRFGKRRLIMSSVLLARAVVILMLLLSRDVVSLSTLYVLASLFLSGFIPLAQSMVADLSESEKLGKSMGEYRLFGSVGWVVSCVLTGLLARENLWNIFPVTFAFSCLSFLASLALPEFKAPDEARPKGGRHEARLTTTMSALFATSVPLSGMSMGATSSFLSISLSQLGGDPLFLGAVIAIGALFEVPAMYLSGRLCDRIGGFPVLLAGEAGLGAVYWLYGTVKTFHSYLLIQGVRGVLYAFFVVSGTSVSSRLGGSRRGGLYAGLYNMSLYLGTTPGPYIGGLASDYLGLWTMFMISSVLSEASAVLILPWVLKGRQRAFKYKRRATPDLLE